MDTLTLSNVAAYSAQLACVVSIAGAASWLLRIDAAPVRYGYWRAVLALCLLLPLLQGREISVRTNAPRTAAAVASGTDAAVASITVPPQSLPSIDWTRMVAVILVAGVTGRVLWIGINLFRLRRMRRLGGCAAASQLHEELQRIIGTRAEIRYADALRQPVTFGLRRPVILLPASLETHSADIQRAVLSHELFHVKRRDWAWLLFEESVCALLWFNPAVWWMVSRLHLARELVVDELAVLATGRRRTYVEALMAFADDTSLAPVAAFGGRRQLFNRIVLLSKEAGMSSHRVVFTCAAMLAVLAAGTWQAVSAFPLVSAAQQQDVVQRTAGPLEQRAHPVTPENPVPRRVSYEAPEYPAEAQAAGAAGTITLVITLDEAGRVAEARPVGGSITTSTPSGSFRFDGTLNDAQARFLRNSGEEHVIANVFSAFQQAAVRAVQQWRYDPPAAAPISFKFTVGFVDPSQKNARPLIRESDRLSAGTGSADGAVRVGGNIAEPRRIYDVRPAYPAIAQAARVSGMVIVEIRIAEDGTVQKAHVLRSIPLLDQAALDAVEQWRFTPTLLNGVPVPVLMTVTVNFTLDEPTMIPPPPPPAPAAGQFEVRPEGSRPSRGAEHVQAVETPVALKKVMPRYPTEAMRARIEGSVELEVIIGPDGTVRGARVLHGVPELNDAAVDAVRQWLFKPFEGEPVTRTLALTFSLR